MSEPKHPWNDAIWDLLTRRQDFLPPGLLFCGVAGLGKAALAIRFARLLLCGAERSADKSSDLFDAGTHPDLHVLAPEEFVFDGTDLAAQYARRYLAEAPGTRGRKAKTVIGVDQIRLLIDRMSRTAHFGGAKVVLINPAERMNINSTNALLKLLEEPPARTTLILITQDPGGLPPTVRSRCLRVEFSAPGRELARSWLSTCYPEMSAADTLLDLTTNAPLAAAALGQEGFLALRDGMLQDLIDIVEGQADPVAGAARWRQIGAATALKWLQGAILDLVRWQQHRTPPALFNPDKSEHFKVLLMRIHLRGLFGLLDAIGEARQHVGGTLDEALLLEDVLLRVQESTRG